MATVPFPQTWMLFLLQKIGTMWEQLYYILLIMLNIHICLHDIPIDIYFGYSLSDKVCVVITSCTIIS